MDNNKYDEISNLIIETLEKIEAIGKGGEETNG